jgi:hypothetical protein
VDDVALFQKLFCKVGAILARDSGNKCDFHGV